MADNKKLHSEIEKTNKWWRDNIFVSELDRLSKALEEGTDKGFTVEQLEASIDILRKKRYRK